MSICSTYIVSKLNEVFYESLDDGKRIDGSDYENCNIKWCHKGEMTFHIKNQAPSKLKNSWLKNLKITQKENWNNLKNG